MFKFANCQRLPEGTFPKKISHKAEAKADVEMFQVVSQPGYNLVLASNVQNPKTRNHRF